MRLGIIAILRAYQVFVSPWHLPVCRYYPSCSYYALESIKKYGSIRGTWQTICRILRCHPLHPGGYDPVK